MAIDYFEGNVDDAKHPLIPEFRTIKEMEIPSEGYCATSTVWFSKQLLMKVDMSGICYGESQISPEADPNDWLRIIHLPVGYIVDGSHQDRIRDDEGKFIEPVTFESIPIREGVMPKLVNDYIETQGQLEVATEIIRQQYGLELSRNVLQDIRENSF